MWMIFARVFNMSVSASYILLTVLLLRLVLKKAPKGLTLLLWTAVGIRLVLPFSSESFWSLIPSLGQLHPSVAYDSPVSGYTGYSGVNALIAQWNEEALTRPRYDRLELLQRLMPVFAVLWLLGVTVLLAYSVVSCCKLQKRVSTAVHRQDNVYQSEYVRSPFVFGFIKPKIYLPFDMGEQSMTHVIAHEQSHIRRLDHWWKPLGYGILALHWFNPLMWLGFVLFCRDMEFACDERVIQKLDRAQRADYSAALLASSVSKPKIAACPLAFGEVGVQKRIKSVLTYRKPAFWVALVTIVACIAAVVCFFVEPVHMENMGIRRVSVKRISDEEFELRIKYAYCYSGYSVELLSPEEPQYVSDGAVPYDGSLGQNRILVSFGDDEPTLSLSRQLGYGETVELKNAPIRILAKFTSPGDHGFVIYFGMDETVEIEQVEAARLDERGGTICIPVRILS